MGQKTSDVIAGFFWGHRDTALVEVAGRLSLGCQSILHMPHGTLRPKTVRTFREPAALHLLKHNLGFAIVTHGFVSLCQMEGNILRVGLKLVGLFENWNAFVMFAIVE